MKDNLTGKNGEKRWAMNDVVKWLESEAGEEWSCKIHENMPITLVSVKTDDYGMPPDFLEFEAIIWYR
jgi:hypothetical protein